jgi:hypothetical protein|tara:strand:+ start:262 stop:702 length:441 start_codon:yes stop_codon:yes gene_type:complete
MDVEFVPTDARHMRFLPEGATPRWCEDTRGITALDPKKGPLGICLMDTWTTNSVQIHIWIGNPMIIKRGFLNEIFGFIFGKDSGRKMVMGITPSDNKKALKFIAHVGMKEIHRVPDGFSDGIDAVITLMKKDDCRWIEHEQKRESA